MTSVRRRGRADSADYSDASRENETNFGTSNDGPVVESDYDSATQSDSDSSERENGDGQESERRVDDDEDRSNPQYIPKRGTFYEHDDRTAGSGEDGGQEGTEGGVNDSVSTSEAGESRGDTPDKRQKPRKSDACDKWSHDKFNDNEQAPKSREELVAIYGYDIRNEDAPPHARRNRRYGRGPTKYTRTWEDEEAYKRANAQAAANRKPQSAPTSDDFPALDNSRPPRRGGKSDRERPPRSHNSTISTDPSSPPSEDRDPRNTNRTPRPRRSRDEDRNASAEHTMPPLDKLTITTTSGSGSNGSTPTSQRKVFVNNAPNSSASPRPVRASQHNMRMVEVVQSPPPSAPMSTPTSAPLATSGVATAAAIQRTSAPPLKQAPSQTPSATQQNTGGIDPVRGKRYSSLRQRPIETAYQPQAVPQNGPQNVPQSVPASVPSLQQQHRYVSEYQAGGVSQHQASPVPQLQQQLMHQVHRLPQQQAGPPQPSATLGHGPSPPHLPPPPPALSSAPTQHPAQMGHSLGRGMPLQHMTPQEPQHPVHTHNMSGGLAATQPYAPPTMMPAQYMQGAGTPVYGGQAVYAAPPAAYQHPIYQPNIHTSHQHQYQHTASVPPPTVSYGTPVQTTTTERPSIMYYTPSDHSAPPEGPRRPSRAVAIVPPPPPAPHKIRAVPENDNIDRIVDNMFVLKSRPATHASSLPKDGKPDPVKSQTSTESRKLSDASSKEGSPSSIDLRPAEDVKSGQADAALSQSEIKPSLSETKLNQIDSNLSQIEIAPNLDSHAESHETVAQNLPEKLELQEKNVPEIADLTDNKDSNNLDVSESQNSTQGA